MTRDWLVGTWRTSANRGLTIFASDSTWKSTGEGDDVANGVWALRDGNIIFTYDNLPQNYHELALILDAGDDHFTVQEMGGSKTIFTRITDEP